MVLEMQRQVFAYFCIVYFKLLGLSLNRVESDTTSSTQHAANDSFAQQTPDANSSTQLAANDSPTLQIPDASSSAQNTANDSFAQETPYATLKVCIDSMTFIIMF